MNVTWNTRNGNKRVITSPIIKYPLILLVWLPLMLISFLIHLPVWAVNGRGFYDRRARSFEPPSWGGSIALIIYATVLVWAVVQVA